MTTLDRYKNALPVAEARSLWCPFARTGLHAGNGGVSVNRDVGEKSHDQTRCLGDLCMAWRWAGEPPRGSDGRTCKPARGYCGLAGQPHHIFKPPGEKP